MLECDEFYGLGPDQVASLIASDTITVPNEEKVIIFNTRAFCSNFLSFEDCDQMFLTPISQPNFITFRCLKVSSPGSSTQQKPELSTCLLSWSTSGCPCSVRIISFTRFVNLIFTNLIQGYESLLIRLTVSLCSSRTITAKTSLLRQWSTICSRLNVLRYLMLAHFHPCILRGIWNWPWPWHHLGPSLGSLLACPRYSKHFGAVDNELVQVMLAIGGQAPKAIR